MSHFPGPPLFPAARAVRVLLSILIAASLAGCGAPATDPEAPPAAADPGLAAERDVFAADAAQRLAEVERRITGLVARVEATEGEAEEAVEAEAQSLLAELQKEHEEVGVLLERLRSDADAGWQAAKAALETRLIALEADVEEAKRALEETVDEETVDGEPAADADEHDGE